ncbi:MAG: alpha/beta fold hydrolase [Verrucomicrobiota bacterium]
MENDIIGGIDSAELAELLTQCDDATAAQLREIIGREAAEELASRLEAETAERESAAGLIAPPDPALPEIVLLHGITDSHLAEIEDEGSNRKNRIWLDLVELIKGRFTRRLPLQPDGVSDQPGVMIKTDGYIDKKYRKALRAWSENRFRNQVFCYDWRRSVHVAADELLAFLQGLESVTRGEKVILVCHSMGGLVAATMAAKHAAWGEIVKHCVFVGSPLAGSYSVPMTILGKSPSFRKMDRLSLFERLSDFQRMAASFPGLIDLLPNPDVLPEAADFYTQSGWPGSIRPGQEFLDASKALKEILWASSLFERSTHLVSQGHDTVAGMPWNTDHSDREPSSMSKEGDGAVLTKSSLAPGLRAFKVTGEHGTLVNEESVFGAVMAIAKDEDPALVPLSPADLTGDLHAGLVDVSAGLVAPSPEEGIDRSFARELAPHFASRDAVTARFEVPDFPGFDRLALRNEGFSWENALNLAMASSDAYRSDQPSMASRYVNTHGFQGYVDLENRETQGFVCWDDAAVVVSIRGTEKKVSDWGRNLLVGTHDSDVFGSVHFGFYKGFKVIEDQLRAALDRAGATGKKIWITGHSLGGAVGTVAGGVFVDDYPITGFYTYGQPRTGFRSLIDFYHQRYAGRFFRFVNNKDIVPTIPPGFKHVGQLFWFDGEGELRNTTAGLVGPEEDLPFEMNQQDYEVMAKKLDEAHTPSQPGALLVPPTDEELEARGLFGLWSVSDHSISKQYIPIIQKHASRT